MAFTTNPYCQLADVKLALGIPQTNTNDDIWLQELIGQAQSDMDDELDYSFQQDGPGSTRLYNGNNGERLVIEDCIAVTQVIETTYNVLLGANGAWTNGTTQTLDITADCVLGPNNAIPGNYLERVSGYPFMAGKQNYKVTGTWGQPSIPANITRACIRLVVHYYKMRAAGYTDRPADTQYGGTLKFAAAMPPDVCAVLEHMKHRRFYSR